MRYQGLQGSEKDSANNRETAICPAWKSSYRSDIASFDDVFVQDALLHLSAAFSDRTPRKCSEARISPQWLDDVEVRFPL